MRRWVETTEMIGKYHKSFYLILSYLLSFASWKGQLWDGGVQLDINQVGKPL